MQNFKVKEKRVMILLDELLKEGIDLDKVSDKLFNEDGSLKINTIHISESFEELKE